MRAGPSAPTLSIGAGTTGASVRKTPMSDRAAMERVWVAHTDGEFVQLDLQATMSTMTDSPTVVHVPTAMGGVGRQSVADFYERWFIGRNPADFALGSVSRTVGGD